MVMCVFVLLFYIRFVAVICVCFVHPCNPRAKWLSSCYNIYERENFLARGFRGHFVFTDLIQAAE
jgi:hypothetical protein